MLKLYRLENITNEEVIYKLDILNAGFGKVDEFGCWDIDIIQTDAGTYFTFKNFQEGLSVSGVRLALA